MINLIHPSSKKQLCDCFKVEDSVAFERLDLFCLAKKIWHSLTFYILLCMSIMVSII